MNAVVLSYLIVTIWPLTSLQLQNLTLSLLLPTGAWGNSVWVFVCVALDKDVDNMLMGVVVAVWISDHRVILRGG